MNLIIAGEKRDDLLAEISREASVLQEDSRRPVTVSSEIGASALTGLETENCYHEHFLRLLRYRDAVDTLDFGIPRKPGFIGWWLSRLKQVLWRLLRHQHDRLAFRQNLINGLFTEALENEHRLRMRETSELRQRLEELEKQNK